MPPKQSKQVNKTQVTLNLPMIMEFRDYHDINFFCSQMNELVIGKKIKAEELGCVGKYLAIFYIEKNDAYKKLREETMVEIKEYELQSLL